MNKVIALAVTIGLALSGCGNKGDDSKLVNQQQNNGGINSPANFEMPKVKYPAAIVFEGGKGDPWFDKDSSKHTPTWRLYICLSKTSQPISGQVEIDLKKLGHTVEVTYVNSKANEPLYTERLNKVILAYTYTTELLDTPETNYGYAYGNATFNSISTQEWENIYQAPDYSRDSSQTRLEDDLFNLNTTKGSLTSYSQKKYGVGDEITYISNWLERFTFSDQDRKSHVIDACESTNKTIVWQFGNEIKRN